MVASSCFLLHSENETDNHNFMSTAVIAQSQEGLMVCYKAHTPNMRNGVDDLTNSFVLLANAGESKFCVSCR